MFRAAPAVPLGHPSPVRGSSVKI